MPKPVISAGFLIRSSNDKYLIVRPSGKTGSTGGWGIPKGKRDKGEPIVNAAIREVFEETNLRIDDNTEIAWEGHPFYHYEVETNEYKKQEKFKKQVYVFRAYCTAKIESFPFKCTSMLECGKPEVDEFKWVTLEEAAEMVVKSQKGIFQFLLKYKELDNDS